ncbi:MAG: type II toxin-antitoxin system PemK/MazF family toxin, partial [Vulcanimicrobiaceae bacterium]
VIVAPMITGSKPTSYRVPITFQGKRGFVLLDQVRTIDKVRLVKRLGASEKALKLALEALHELFAI